MPLDTTKVLGKGQFLHDVTVDPQLLYIGDGVHTIAELIPVNDQTAIRAIISALSGATLKVNAGADAKTIEAALEDIRTLIAGAKMGIVFDTEVNFLAWLEGTYTREDGQVVADLIPGQAIYIKEANVPDYWWDGTDAQESEVKIDLSGYSTTSQMNTAIETAVDEAVGELPAASKTMPPNDGHAYAIRDGAWVRIMLGASDLQTA